jgi:hypothetical protein
LGSLASLLVWSPSVSVLVHSAVPDFPDCASTSAAPTWEESIQRHDLIRDLARLQLTYPRLEPSTVTSTYLLVLSVATCQHLAKQILVSALSTFNIGSFFQPYQIQPVWQRPIAQFNYCKTPRPPNDPDGPTTRRCAANHAEDVASSVRFRQCLTYRFSICDLVSSALLQAFASSPATAFYPLQRFVYRRRHEVLSDTTPETICRK